MGARVKRRAQLNPDDPNGTKYMDTVTNVLGVCFDTMPRTSMSFIRAMAESRDPHRKPQRYRELFDGIDAEQVIVVSGEEDNELPPVRPPEPQVVPAPSAPFVPTPEPSAAAASSDAGEEHGCAVGGTVGGARAGVPALTLGAMAVAWRRRRRPKRTGFTPPS
jgi:MYXO-CTERM domain-containing protein